MRRDCLNLVVWAAACLLAMGGCRTGATNSQRTGASGRELTTARSALEEALGLAPKVEDAGERAMVLARVAEILADRDVRWSREVARHAVEAAGTVEDEEARGALLGYIAGVLGQSDTGGGLDVAQQIRNPRDRSEALAKVAAAVAKSDPHRSERIADEAVATALTISDEEECRWALYGVVKALIKTAPVQALEVVGRIPEGGKTDLSARGMALSEVASALVDKYGEQALEIARAVEDAALRSQATGAVAYALINADPEGAIEALSSIKDEEGPAPFLGSIVEELAKKNPARALEVAQSIEKDTRWQPTVRDVAFSQVAEALAETDPEQALKVGRTVEDGNLRTQVFAKVIGVLSGREPQKCLAVADEALALARSLALDYDRALALSRLAEALAGAGPPVPRRSPARR